VLISFEGRRRRFGAESWSGEMKRRPWKIDPTSERSWTVWVE